LEEKNEKQSEDLSSKLDILIIIHLAKLGFSQKEIGKIIKMSDHKIKNIFGKNYQKLQGELN